MKLKLAYLVQHLNQQTLLLGVSGLLLLATSTLAQRRSAAFPAPTPAPTEDPTLHRNSGSLGSCQGLDGTWRAVQVQGWENDRVYLSEAGSTGSKAYSPTELKRFVALGDTIVAAHDVVISRRRFLFKRRPQLVPAAFGRQLYRGGGFQLLDYDPSRPSTFTSALSSHLLLRRAQEAWQVLPPNTAAFNQLMLMLLGTNPDLAAGLRAGQYHTRRDAAYLLERYADQQIRQFLQTTAQPGR